MTPGRRERRERVMSGADRSPAAHVVRSGLRMVALAYEATVRARNAAYDTGLFSATQVDAHVISVGNLTAGGTGKTPVAVALANERCGRGERVAILTRGYGAAGSVADRVLVVSDGAGARCSPEQAGDEPWLLAELADRAAVLLCPDRVAAARYAVDTLNAATLILDDGFQHRRLARDEEWVLVDALEPWGHGALLPRGLLREPLSSLRRATTVVISRADQAPDVAQVEETVRRHNPGACLVWAVHAPVRLRSALDADPLPLSALQGTRVCALSGIGNPAAFEHTVRSLGADVACACRYEDHHRFTARDLADLGRLQADKALDGVVTTEKDAVRLAPLGAPPFPVWVLGVDATLLQERPAPAAPRAAP